MKVLGCLGFYSCYIENIHVDSQPFYGLNKDSTPFHWTEEHEKLFNSLKERIHKDTVLAVPSTDYPFHNHVDSSNAGTGCIVIQQFPEGKRIISFNSRVFDKAEQKMSSFHRELCGIVSGLQTYEQYITGSPFPNCFYCDHKPILYLWGRRGQLSHRSFRYQVITTKLQNLMIIKAPGSNLAFPVILSQNITIQQYQMHQLQHKRNLRDIEFFGEKGTPVLLQIQHEDNPSDTCNDFYPIRYKRVDEEKILRLQNDGEDFAVSNPLDEVPIKSIQQASDCFGMGRFINQLRRMCGPEAQSNLSVNTSDTDYSSINSYSSSPDDTADPTSHCHASCHISTDSEDHSIVCDISNQADKPQLCQAKHAHELVLGTTNFSSQKTPNNL